MCFPCCTPICAKYTLYVLHVSCLCADAPLIDPLHIDEAVDDVQGIVPNTSTVATSSVVPAPITPPRTQPVRGQTVTHAPLADAANQAARSATARNLAVLNNGERRFHSAATIHDVRCMMHALLDICLILLGMQEQVSPYRRPGSLDSNILSSIMLRRASKLPSFFWLQGYVPLMLRLLD